MPPIIQRMTLLKIAARTSKTMPTVINVCLPCSGVFVSIDSIRCAARDTAGRAAIPARLSRMVAVWVAVAVLAAAQTA